VAGPAAGYDQSAYRDHLALHPCELDHTDLEAIREAIVPERARELDGLLDRIAAD
jgi:hypothetical protein